MSSHFDKKSSITVTIIKHQRSPAIPLLSALGASFAIHVALLALIAPFSSAHKTMHEPPKAARKKLLDVMLLPQSVTKHTTRENPVQQFISPEQPIDKVLPGEKEGLTETGQILQKEHFDEIFSDEQIFNLAGVLPVWPSYYLSAKVLDVRPMVIEDVPGNPESLSAFPDEGEAVLWLWLNEAGIPDYVSIENTNLPEEVATTISATFERTKFTPGMKGTTPVKTRLRIVVNLAPKKLPVAVPLKTTPLPTH